MLHKETKEVLSALKSDGLTKCPYVATCKAFGCSLLNKYSKIDLGGKAGYFSQNSRDYYFNFNSKILISRAITGFNYINSGMMYFIFSSQGHG